MFAIHFENMTISIVRPTEFVINPTYAELTAQCIISRDIFSFFLLLYFQGVVTLQKKYIIYLQQKMRFTAFINYYDTLGWILFVYRAK